jgi:hypothetical protein
MLFGETVAVYCENHMEHTDTLCGQNAEVNLLVWMTTCPDMKQLLPNLHTITLPDFT